MSPCGDARVSTVQPAPGYNSWPMIQTVGDKIVCAYSKGTAHNICEEPRGVYARTSTDGGKTWGEEVCVANDPSVGEVTIGKGRDSKGAMLLWVRRWGRAKGHDLYRTKDGRTFEKIASPKFSPMPMQVTDVFSVPGVGLMSLWFGGKYGKEEDDHYWGTLTSADNGRTWTQRTIGDNVAKKDWPTEQSAVYLGDGRILVVARSEGGDKPQFQLTSTDGGATWRCCRTNIRDVFMSTPSLIYDSDTGLVANYYYHRGAKLLKRRVVDAKAIFDHPMEWPEPEVLAEGGERGAADAGNVNAVRVGESDLLALYSGTRQDCAVFVVTVSKPVLKSSCPASSIVSNPVRNPGFEDGDSKVWALDSQMIVEDGVGRSGSRGVHVRKAAPGRCYLWQKAIPAESGRIYSFEGWVRLGGGLTNGPMYFAMNWYGRDGRELGGSEGRPLIHEQQLKGNGWVKVSGATPRTPAGTASIGIGCSFRDGCSCDVYVDDFRIFESGKRHIEHIYTSAYRDVAVDGKVKFAVPYICDTNECPAEALAADFVFTGADGKKCRVPADRLGVDGTKETSFEATIDVGRFARGTHNVRAILRTKGGTVFDTAEIAFTRAAELPPRKVWFDSRRRLIVDGKPFFPMGMYLENASKDDMGLYTQAPFNTALCGASRDRIDSLAGYGLKVIAGTTKQTDPDKLYETLRKLKGHPSIIAWYTNDEFPPGLIARQTELQRIYREVDPDHPTFTVLDKPWQVRMFLPTFDVIGMDPYPIGNSHRGGIDIAYGWADSCSMQCFGMRPMWQVPQAFDWRWFRNGLDDPEFRFPSPEEFRSMTWQAVAAGANGLIYYSFNQMRRRMKAPGEFDRHWSPVKETIKEVVKHIPVILSDGLPPKVSGASRAVPVRVWRYRNATWILAVNTMRNRQTVTLSVDAPIGDVSAAFGPRPTIDERRRIVLGLAPLDVAMLVFR